MATHTRIIIIIIIILISLIVCQNDYVCKRKNTLVSSRQNSGLNPVHATDVKSLNWFLLSGFFGFLATSRIPCPSSLPFHVPPACPIQWISLSWYMLQPYTRRLWGPFCPLGIIATEFRRLNNRIRNIASTSSRDCFLFLSIEVIALVAQIG